jgi:hypothetical protein
VDVGNQRFGITESWRMFSYVDTAPAAFLFTVSPWLLTSLSLGGLRESAHCQGQWQTAIVVRAVSRQLDRVRGAQNQFHGLQTDNASCRNKQTRSAWARPST